MRMVSGLPKTFTMKSTAPWTRNGSNRPGSSRAKGLGGRGRGSVATQSESSRPLTCSHGSGRYACGWTFWKPSAYLSSRHQSEPDETLCGRDQRHGGLQVAGLIRSDPNGFSLSVGTRACAATTTRRGHVLGFDGGDLRVWRSIERPADLQVGQLMTRHDSGRKQRASVAGLHARARCGKTAERLAATGE